MKIANIYPVKNQQFYQNEQYTMILAHLVKKGLYNPQNFCKEAYIIMDNGLFEKQQISTNLLDCIKCAKNSGIPVNEIIIPDAVNDSQETIRLFEQNLTIVKKYQHKYRFMFVAQAKNCKELSKMIAYINQHKHLNLSVGISKLSPINRACKTAIDVYKRCKLPIHFLGLKSSFDELDQVKDIIRGCDSSQLAFIAKNVEKELLDFDAYNNNFKLWQYQRKGIDIDLEYDELDNNKLAALCAEFKKNTTF